MNANNKTAAKDKILSDTVKPIPTVGDTLKPKILGDVIADLSNIVVEALKADASIRSVMKVSGLVGSMLTAYGLNVRDVGQYTSLVFDLVLKEFWDNQSVKVNVVLDEASVYIPARASRLPNGHLPIHSIIRRNVSVS